MGLGRIIIMALSATSALVFAYGVISYRWSAREPFTEWCMVGFAGIGLVPALVAAGLVVIRYDTLDGLTLLIGLAPVVLLPLAILYLIWSFRPRSPHPQDR
jgi:hypothetical protein